MKAKVNIDMYNKEMQSFKIDEIIIQTKEDFYEKVVNKDFDMFRGESNANWTLNSSIVRKLKSHLNNQPLTLNNIVLTQIVSKYKYEYDEKISSQHDYVRFLFYLQHSVSLSPFIDITENVWVALSFALQQFQETPGKEKQGDAALYAFEIKGNKGNNKAVLTTQKQVQEVLNNLSIGINKINVSKENVESYILNINGAQFKNDRMMYQKGSFLLLNNYSINVDNISLQKYSDKQIRIVKFILSKEVLGVLYSELRDQQPKYTIKYLYDPYLAFKDMDGELRFLISSEIIK